MQFKGGDGEALSVRLLELSLALAEVGGMAPLSSITCPPLHPSPPALAFGMDSPSISSLSRASASLFPGSLL